MNTKKVGLIFFSAFLLCSLNSSAASDSSTKVMKTRWADEASEGKTWKSYPRPQLQRELWENLNGSWDYAVTDQNAKFGKVSYEGKILVPFCIESVLSGVDRKFNPEDELWYKRTFAIAPSWKGKRILLHFGAVDYKCTAYVDGKIAGSHEGGNNPFYFDITDCLKGNGSHTLELSVTDPTDTGSQPRGKQVLNPKGIWYEAVSGIWKTVWMEPVNEKHIEKILPSFSIKDSKAVFDVRVSGATGKESVGIIVRDNGRIVAQGKNTVGKPVEIKFDDVNLWTPENPKLFDLEIVLSQGKKALDKADSYFAMREITKQKDSCGYERIALNGNPIFQYGPLDQGWWPDGLLTPPSEKAMLWDMTQLKDMGFNMIRKHIKVEPELYYYYADSLGLMMWQDMPSGFNSSNAKVEHVAPVAEKDWNAPADVVSHWKQEYKEMVDIFAFYPCITTWVVFNEGWGQHNTAEMTDYARSLDKTRIINAVTGWTDRNVGDIYDVHNYPETAMRFPEEVPGRITVLGEFGGVSLAIPGHLWKEDKNWGYRTLDRSIDLLSGYTHLVYNLETLVAQGLGAAVYTQTTDVEGEINGLMTYDREITKYPVEVLNFLHHRLYVAEPASATILLKATKPVSVAPKEVYEGEYNFNADKEYSNISLFSGAAGQAVIWLNGHKVFSGEVRKTRTFEQYNISHHSAWMKKGENVLKVRVENTTKKPTDATFQLRAF